MPQEFTIGTTRTMTILDGLGNPKPGYQISFTFKDKKGNARNSYVQVLQAGADTAGVHAAIKEEIDRINSWL